MSILYFYNKMKREIPAVSLPILHPQGLIQLEENCQLISIIGKKIEEQTAKKVNKVQLIDIDHLQLQNEGDREKFGNLLKVANDAQSSNYQICESEFEDQDYIPQLDSSESQIVQRYKLHRLRMRDLKTISKQEFQRQMLPNQPIEIIDLKPENFDKNKQKKQQVKIGFKEQAAARTTKKTKMEFLLKNGAIPLRTSKNKKIVKSLQKISKQLN